MKKTLKLISLLLAGTMSLPTAVFADSNVKEKIKDWQFLYNEPTPEEQAVLNPYIPTDKANCYASLSTETVRSGEKSLFVKNSRTAKQNYTSLELKPLENENISDGTYTLEFYLKGTYDNKGISAGFGNDGHPITGTYFALSSSKIKKEEVENGWTRYNATFSYTSDKEIHIEVTHGCSGFYIDDVSVYGEDGVNLLSNGGFENVEYEIIEETKIEVGTPTDWAASARTIVTTDDSYSGKAALKIGGYGSGVASQTLNFDSSSEYVVTVYAKVMTGSTYKPDWDFMISAHLGGINNDIFHLDSPAWEEFDTDKPDWKKYVATYTPSTEGEGSGGFRIGNNNPAATETSFRGYIDNISVVRADDETKTNILKNGDFEEYNVSRATITGIEKTGYKEVTVSWRNPAFNSTAVKIYLNGKAVPAEGVDLTANAENTAVVKGIKAGEEYILTVTNEIYEVPSSVSEKIFIEANGIEIGPFILNDGAKNIQAGNNKISIGISNYTGEKIDAELMTVVRKGKLITEIASLPTTASNGEVTAETTVSIADLEDGEYTITAYLWDGFSAMEILTPNVVFTE